MEAAERRHRRRLLAREERIVRDLVRTWRGTEAELRRRIDALIAKIEDAQAIGIEVSEAWLYEQDRYQLLLKQTREQIDRYAVGAMERTEEAQRTSTQAGADDAQDLMQRTEIRARFVRLPAEQVEALSGYLADGSPLAEIFERFAPQAVQGVRDVLLRGVALGENPRDIGRKLAREVEGLGRDRAVLIARTESIRAYRTAQIESYRANDDVLTGWRWVCARQTRTCPACWSLSGQVFPLDRPMASHPACRCTQSPVTENSPQRATGEEEFAKLPARDQKQILGPGKYELYRDGKISLADTVEETHSARWGPGLQVKSLRKIRETLP